MPNLWKLIKQMFGDTTAGIDVAGVVVEVVLVTALIPVIAMFIANATNLTATETTLLSLTTLFIVLALIFGIVKSAGIGHKVGK